MLAGSLASAQRELKNWGVLFTDGGRKKLITAEEARALRAAGKLPSPGAVLTPLGKMEAEDADTCTILAGEGYSDEDLEALVAKIEEAYDELEVDAQRGEQPLYPIVFSVE